jgi:hypothetical protein
VEDYQLVFHGPFKVEVIVHDKSIVGYVSHMSSYMYFDRDGIIVGKLSRLSAGNTLDHRSGIWTNCFVQTSSGTGSEDV